MIMVFVYRPMKMDPEELQRREIELQGGWVEGDRVVGRGIGEIGLQVDGMT